MEIEYICFIVKSKFFFLGNDTSSSIEFSNSSTVKCENVSRSIDDFPPDFFTDDQRRHGAVVFHFLVAFYGFVFIAFVCNDYFLPSVFCICLGTSHTYYFTNNKKQIKINCRFLLGAELSVQ